MSAQAPDRYAVIGHPVAHSRSPVIHALFARQTGHSIDYGRLPAPPDGFLAAVEAFRREGGRGLNVTLPFKAEAFALADTRSARAQAAGAVNTLAFDGERIFGDNTDGAGLLRDVSRLGLDCAGARVLLLGAGGAARGVLHPLLDAGVRRIVVANRTAARARALADAFGDARITGCGLDAVAPGGASAGEPFELLVNATSGGLADEVPPIAPMLLANARLCYDMVYAARPTAFVRAAAEAGCTRAVDGLGMLVEQAAESFFVWRGVRPDTGPVHAALRAALDAEAANVA